MADSSGPEGGKSGRCGQGETSLQEAPPFSKAGLTTGGPFVRLRQEELMAHPMQDLGFDMEVERTDDRACVRLAGEFDLACKGAFEQEMAALASERLGELVVDLSGLSFIDSCGLRLLVELLDRSRREGFEFRLIPGPRVQSLFELTGLDQVLPGLNGAPATLRRTARRRTFAP
jgi:anti-sigma B factor antagonist